MADADRAGRPLSPHLSVYKPEWTMVLSISHRITGVGLALGALILSWLLLAAATGPEYYAEVAGWLDTWLGQLVLLGFVFALWYHFANGVRHLLWDIGWGLELERARKSGQAVVVFAAAATLFTLVL
jgi:succinate dehydrogenase, cytochrome b556 subunit